MSTHPQVLCGDLVSTVGEVFAAAESCALWPAVLDSIAGSVESDSAVFLADCSGPLADHFQALSHGTSEPWKPYREHDAAVKLLTERRDRMFSAGSLRYSHQTVPDSELKGTESYADSPVAHEMCFRIEISLGANRSPRKSLLLCSLIV